MNTTVIKLEGLTRGLLEVDRIEIQDPVFKVVSLDGTEQTASLPYNTKLDMDNPFSIVWAVRHRLRGRNQGGKS